MSLRRSFTFSRCIRPLAFFCALALIASCQSQPSANHVSDAKIVVSTTGLSPEQAFPALEAIACPPAGWMAEPIKQSKKHIHQVWLSPSKKTAYGIIRFNMPLPVGPDLALGGYIKGMKATEGDAVLLKKERDDSLPGIRFAAEGGLYRTYGNLIVHGWTGWSVYAGVLRKEAEVPEELDLAKRAREHTRVDVSSDASAR